MFALIGQIQEETHRFAIEYHRQLQGGHVKTSVLDKIPGVGEKRRQQLLKRFNVFVYVGKRLWDIELMALELDNLYQARVLERDVYLQAKLVLKKEHREEEKYQQER